jgi:hypothetical protein
MKISSRSVFLIFACLVVLLCSCAGCASQKVKIVSVKRVDTFGFPGMQAAKARPGYDILLIAIKTDEDISPFGGDLVLKDNNGNSYPNLGLFTQQYIFEVPKTVNKFTLVVKNTIEVPLP